MSSLRDNAAIFEYFTDFADFRTVILISFRKRVGEYDAVLW